MKIISIETCQKKKKKQKENIEEIDTKTWKKKQAKRVSSSYNINFLYSIKTSGKTLNLIMLKLIKKKNKKIMLLSKQLI